MLTTSAITREALALFINENPFLRRMNRQYDDSFARAGAKIGAQLRIRLPNDYTVRHGPTAVPQSTNEQVTTLALATQSGVDLSFSSVDRTLSMDDFKTRVLRPAMNVLSGDVAKSVMVSSEQIPNMVRASGTGGATATPGLATYTAAGALLDLFSTPQNGRLLVEDPVSQSRAVAQFSTLFNSQSKIGTQYETGMIGNDVLGFDWLRDNTVIKHTTGNYGTPPTVAGANQTGSVITVSALAGPLNVGDIISFAGVNSVNRVTKQDNGTLAQFAVTAPVAGGATSIPIYPALTGVDSGGNTQPFQTVTASPANGAAVIPATNAGETYRKNFGFHPDAVTFVSADLDLPQGVHEAARVQFGGVSMRMITAYNITTDQWITRFDILYGYSWTRPEWGVIVCDML